MPSSDSRKSWPGLRGKVGIITGAGSGIGRACAILFARSGVSLVLTDIDERSGSATRAAVTAEGADAEFLGGDIAAPGTAESLVERAVAAFGRLDLVVNCAAAMAGGTLAESAPDGSDLDRVLAVNVRGPWLLSRAALPRIGRGGSLLIISSITGIVGAPGLAAYSVSKGALLTLTRTLALEVAEAGIRVNCICPGSIDTAMLQASFDQTEDPAAARERNILRHPIGRLGRPEDVAQLAAFLSSDDAGFITGATHVIDGGALLARRWRE